MEEKFWWDIFMTSIVICFATIFLFALIFHFVRFIRAHRSGTLVQGMVVGNDLISKANAPRLFTPTVEYETLDGVHIRTKAGLSTIRKLEPGSQVRIFYDPRNPSVFFYEKDRVTPTIMMLAAIISVVALVSSVLRLLHLAESLNNW
jgi:hypothetical protein